MTTWIKGQGGKPKGAKDRFPRSAKRVVEYLLERIGTDETLMERVLRRGLEARPPASFPYLKLILQHNELAGKQEIVLSWAEGHNHDSGSLAAIRDPMK
jgi:hypothetical protein